MINELKKTIVFVVVALVLLGVAIWRTPSRGLTEESFSDQGQPFFPNFKNPLECTSLEVVDWDSSTATPSAFKVMFKDGKWIIPSHHNYPADAKDRLAKTAAGVMDLKKDTVRSDRPEDYEDLGVIDPLDTKNTNLKGRGKRVTLRNKSDEVLADFIIGKEVPGHTEQHFVRVPGQRRTYGINVKVELSTRFADWIETNLLKADASRVRKLAFDTHKVIPEERRIVPGEVLTVTRKDASGPWTIEGVKLASDEEPNADKLSTLTSSLGDLKIVGVRPKPAGLTQELRTGSEVNLSEPALVSLQSKGFYLARDGRLVSNQGDLIASTDEGVVYTLRFGEVVFASGEELTAGTDDAKTGKDKNKQKDEKKKSEGAAENRYLFVTASFDESLIPPPEQPKPKEKAAGEIFEDPFQRDPSDPKLAAEAKAAREEVDRIKADNDRRVKEGKDRVKELSERFAGWYYVVPGDAFRSLMLDRASLIRRKQPNPPPGAPGGLPPGMPTGLPTGSDAAPPFPGHP